MEIIIGVLLVGFLGLVGLILKTSTDDAKKSKAIEDGKARRISDLEAQLLQKDGELKKQMEDRQKLEEEFFKAKDDAEIFKRENADLQQKLKQSDKLREEVAVFKDEIKQKDMIAQQETTARQKMEGELALRESELEKLQKELDDLKSQLKSKNEMFEGLKGQYNELEAELQKLRMDGLGKAKGPFATKEDSVRIEPPKPESSTSDVQKAESPKDEKPVRLESSKMEAPKPETYFRLEVSKPEPAKFEPPQAEHPSPEPLKAEPPKTEQTLPKDSEQTPPEAKDETIEKKFGIDTGIGKKDSGPEVPKSDEIPGFPKSQQVKLDIKKGVPGDVEFFKAETKKAEEETAKPLPVAEPFKFTNINKPVVPSASPAENKEGDAASSSEKSQEKKASGTAQDRPADPSRDKQKSKRETLIPGFQPKAKEDKPE